MADSSLPVLPPASTRSRTPSPPLGSTMAHETTMEELELKMKDLELRFLGREVPRPELSPFTPHSILEKRIEYLKESLATTSSGISAKLPPIPLPVFDGSDLEAFLKDFGRWLRLSGVEGSSEALKMDWLIQCSASKVKKVVKKVVEEQDSPRKFFSPWPNSFLGSRTTSLFEKLWRRYPNSQLNPNQHKSKGCWWTSKRSQPK